MVIFKPVKIMSGFYIKNNKGEFVPVEINKVVPQDLDDSLIIVRVGNDQCQATPSDIDATIDSFSQAEILKKFDNLSIILTPYQIKIDICKKDEIDDKYIYLQVESAGDIIYLEDCIKKLYKELKKDLKNVKPVILPTPLKVNEYRSVKDILKRSEIRKKRRSGK